MYRPKRKETEEERKGRSSSRRQARSDASKATTAADCSRPTTSWPDAAHQWSEPERFKWPCTSAATSRAKQPTPGAPAPITAAVLVASKSRQTRPADAATPAAVSAVENRAAANFEPKPVSAPAVASHAAVPANAAGQADGAAEQSVTVHAANAPATAYASKPLRANCPESAVWLCSAEQQLQLDAGSAVVNYEPGTQHAALAANATATTNEPASDGWIAAVNGVGIGPSVVRWPALANGIPAEPGHATTKRLVLGELAALDAAAPTADNAHDL